MEKKTILLENDDWFWAGLEDWCKTFDQNFTVKRTDYRDWMHAHDLRSVAMLAQPFIGNLLVASAFEGKMHTPLKKEEYPQLLHWFWIIEAAFIVREQLGYEPFEIHINYRDEDFVEDIISEKWGHDTSASIKRFVRQNPEKLKIKIYKEYEYLYTLNEENLKI